MRRQPYRGILTIIGFWLAFDGLASLLYVSFVYIYPNVIVWQGLRFIRVAVGITLVLEAHRLMSSRRHADTASQGGGHRVRQFYRDFLVILGVWATVDGVRSMLYLYPILAWQLIRFARLVIGVIIIVEARFQVFSSRLEGEKAV